MATPQNGMAENYEDAEVGTAAPPTMEEAPEVESEETEETQEASALVPKDLFPDGVKPGDTITMKVVSVHEEEVELAPSFGGEESEMPMKPAMAEAEMGLENLAQ